MSDDERFGSTVLGAVCADYAAGRTAQPAGGAPVRGPAPVVKAVFERPETGSPAQDTAVLRTTVPAVFRAQGAY